jgi:hypothetical protein
MTGRGKNEVSEPSVIGAEVRLGRIEVENESRGTKTDLNENWNEDGKSRGKSRIKNRTKGKLTGAVQTPEMQVSVAPGHTFAIDPQLLRCVNFVSEKSKKEVEENNSRRSIG